jgi:integrase
VLSVAMRKSVAALETVSAAVNWHCAEVGAATPFDNKHISLLVRGMKVEFRRPAQPRLPFTRLHIRRLMTAGWRNEPCAWRAAVVMAVCFADFLRFSEVSNVRLQDISLKKNSVSFRVRKAKNHRLGFDVCLPVDRKRQYCVGAYLVRFIKQALKWSPGDDGFFWL